MDAPWAVTPEKIDVAVKRIVSVAAPGKVILFGSVVSGKPNTHSDVDFLVVTKDEVESRRKESVRIRRALRGISMPMDSWSFRKSGCRNWQTNRASSTVRRSATGGWCTTPQTTDKSH